MNIPKNYEGEEREYTWMDTKTYPVENYIGKDKKELKSSHYKFKFLGEGNIVLDQIPRVGSMIEEGDYVMIQLGDIYEG